MTISRELKINYKVSQELLPNGNVRFHKLLPNGNVRFHIKKEEETAAVARAALNQPQQVSSPPEVAVDKKQELFKKGLLGKKEAINLLLGSILNLQVDDVAFLTLEELIELTITAFVIKVIDVKSPPLDLIEKVVSKKFVEAVSLLNKLPLSDENKKLLQTLNLLVVCKDIYKLKVFETSSEITFEKRKKVLLVVHSLIKKWVQVSDFFKGNLFHLIGQFQHLSKKEASVSVNRADFLKLEGGKRIAVKDLKGLDRNLLAKKIFLQLFENLHREFKQRINVLSAGINENNDSEFMSQTDIAIATLRRLKISEVRSENVMAALKKYELFLVVFNGVEYDSKEIDEFYSQLLFRINSQMKKFMGAVEKVVDTFSELFKPDQKCSSRTVAFITFVFSKFIKDFESIDDLSDWCKKNRIEIFSIEQQVAFFTEIREILLDACLPFKKRNEDLQQLAVVGEKLPLDPEGDKKLFLSSLFEYFSNKAKYFEESVVDTQIEVGNSLKGFNAICAWLLIDLNKHSDNKEKAIIEDRKRIRDSVKTRFGKDFSIRNSQILEAEYQQYKIIRESLEKYLQLISLLRPALEILETTIRGLKANLDILPVDESWLDDVDDENAVVEAEEKEAVEECQELVVEKSDDAQKPVEVKSSKFQLLPSPYDNQDTKMIGLFREALVHEHHLLDNFPFHSRQDVQVAKYQQVSSLHNLQWALELFHHVKEDSLKKFLLSWVSFFGHQALEQAGKVEYFQKGKRYDFKHQLQAIFKYLELSVNHAWIRHHNVSTRYMRYPLSVLSSSDFLALPKVNSLSHSVQLILHNLRLCGEDGFKELNESLSNDVQKLVALQVEVVAVKTFKEKEKAVVALKPVVNAEALKVDEISPVSKLSEEIEKDLNLQQLMDIEKKLRAKIETLPNIRAKKALYNVLHHLKGLINIIKLFKEVPNKRFVSFFGQLAFIHTRYLSENLGVYLSIQKNPENEIHDHDLQFYFEEFQLGNGNPDFLKLFKAFGKNKEGEYLYHYPTESTKSYLMTSLTSLFSTSRDATRFVDFDAKDQKQSELDAQKKLCKHLKEYMHLAETLITQHL